MKFVKKSDFLVLAALFLLCAGGWLFWRFTMAERPAKAEIWYGSELVETVELVKGEERVFSVSQNEQVAFRLSADGNIRFESSDCPDKVCIRSGALSHPGESAACLPNQLILKVVPAEGQEHDGVDMVTG